MIIRLARQVEWYTCFQPLPLTSAINRGLSIKSRGHQEASHTFKYWSSKLQKSGSSSSSSLPYIKTWVFKYFLNSSNLLYQDLKESAVDPKISCETLGLAFEGKNWRKLSTSLREPRRLYSHIFLNLYIL